MNSAPPMTSASLFASRMRLPARAAASVAGSPAAPTIAASTQSASGNVAASHRPSSPATTRVGRHSAASARCSECAASTSCSAASGGRKRRQRSSSFASLRCAASAATLNRSGWRAMTSSVDAPTDPVAPSSVIARRVMSGATKASVASATGGIAASSASVRSRMPPCPGSSVPLSLTPARRFSSDSCRSPTIDSAASTMANAIHSTTDDASPALLDAGARRERHEQSRIDGDGGDAAPGAFPRFARTDRGASL